VQRGPDFRPFIEEVDRLGLDPAVHAAIMGDNAARLLGLADRVTPATVQPPAKTPSAPAAIPGAPLTDLRLSAAALAVAWPATRGVLDRQGIGWQDRPAPAWEPLEQAAAARGLGPDQRAELLAELNAVIAAASI